MNEEGKLMTCEEFTTNFIAEIGLFCRYWELGLSRGDPEIRSQLSYYDWCEVLANFMGRPILVDTVEGAPCAGCGDTCEPKPRERGANGKFKKSK